MMGTVNKLCPCDVFPTDSELNHLLNYKFDYCSYKLVVFLACLMLLFFFNFFEGTNLSMHRFIDINYALNWWQPHLHTFIDSMNYS
jgi:hypothetical protein